ncbi:hypothetical protein RQM51_25000, partial [Citrobacter portucalensis]
MSKQIIDIGIAESSRVEIADGLSRLLADTYTLYIKGSSLVVVAEGMIMVYLIARGHRHGRKVPLRS